MTGAPVGAATVRHRRPDPPRVSQPEPRRGYRPEAPKAEGHRIEGVEGGQEVAPTRRWACHKLLANNELAGAGGGLRPKETQAGFDSNPTTTWTGTWRDPNTFGSVDG